MNAEKTAVRVTRLRAWMINHLAPKLRRAHLEFRLRKLGERIGVRLDDACLWLARKIDCFDDIPF